MADLSGQIGELRMVLEIKRKETGETEIVELIGKVTDDGGDALDGDAFVQASKEYSEIEPVAKAAADLRGLRSELAGLG